LKAQTRAGEAKNRLKATNTEPANEQIMTVAGLTGKPVSRLTRALSGYTDKRRLRHRGTVSASTNAWSMLSVWAGKESLTDRRLRHCSPWHRVHIKAGWQRTDSLGPIRQLGQDAATGRWFAAGPSSIRYKVVVKRTSCFSRIAYTIAFYQHSARLRCNVPIYGSS
jgi:hypothetical protein